MSLNKSKEKFISICSSCKVVGHNRNGNPCKDVFFKGEQWSFPMLFWLVVWTLHSKAMVALYRNVPEFVLGQNWGEVFRQVFFWCSLSDRMLRKLKQASRQSAFKQNNYQYIFPPWIMEPLFVKLEPLPAEVTYFDRNVYLPPCLFFQVFTWHILRQKCFSEVIYH